MISVFTLNIPKWKGDPEFGHNVAGLAPYNLISDAFCSAQKSVTGDSNTFGALGGLKTMGQSFSRGVVFGPQYLG
ncbi:hypothetical protein FRB95_003468 [Tulasnella sp. JGI-2019a]|nr:hypothetical protein FRB95_003468 [Tulasnella sp. JGI-2019a]